MKIAIVGSAPSSKLLAPYDDPTWEIWGLNFGYNYMKRWDKFFELHSPMILQANHMDRLKFLKTPLYMQTQSPDFPTSIAYPLQQVKQHFGHYFTNTIAYMTALAILQEPEEIGLWGVDMAITEEYIAQRPSCEYFVGWALGAGIKVTIPPESDLCKTAQLYGFGIKTGDYEYKKKTRKQELTDRLTGVDAFINEVQTKSNQLIQDKVIERAALVGAMEQLEYEKQWESQ